MIKINHVCSLGFMCHASSLLKRNNYKKCSYPFDWIFSDCNMILDCIKTNFKIFLDKSFYVKLGIYIGHTKYLKYVWLHHNPLEKEEDYNYYIRCVNRFKELLKKKQKKLFIMMNVNQNDSIENIKKSIIDFNKNFSKYTSNYRLLFIHHIPNKIKNSHTFSTNNNIDFLELNTISISDGASFKDNNDNIYLDKILNSRYKFKIL
jgi:hypothetical protein